MALLVTLKSLLLQLDPLTYQFIYLAK